MEKEEHEYLETSAQRIMEQLCIVQSLDRILEEVYITLGDEYIKPVDIEYLIRIFNREINLIKPKLSELEQYLLHYK